MLFFKLTDILTARTHEDGLSEEKFCQQCQKATNELLELSDYKFFMWLVENDYGQYTFAIVAYDQESFQYYLTAYLKKIQKRLIDFNYDELTFNYFMTFVKEFSEDNMQSIEAIFKEMGLTELLDAERTPILSDVLAQSKKIPLNKLEIYSSSLEKEIFRLKNSDDSNEETLNHYVIKSENLPLTQNIMHVLINELAEKNKLATSRYTIVSIGKIIGEQHLGFEFLEKVYATSVNGTVALGIPRMNEFVYEAWFEKVISLIEKYQEKVLTIIYTDNATDYTEFLLAKFSQIKLVPIEESFIPLKKAQEILVNDAKKDYLKPDDTLKELFNSETDITFAKIKEEYRLWRKNKIQQLYHKENEEPEEPTTAHSSEAYEQLQKMIGLTSVKKAVDEAIAYNCLAKEMKNRHLKSAASSMHMIFTGNPGTAKTTVARLFGEIMRDYGILPKGHFFEVGRSDLVAQYVGQTAPKVKALFEKAKGSVLFIDEAYSLVDDDERHTFADEAISTIVQEMENNREQMIVIFAGYPEKMTEFINKNPGLKSRIAREINFPDYTSEELYAIGKLEAEKKGLHLPDETKSKFLEIIEAKYLADPKNFGNGRTARNIVEQGQMSLASRLFKKDLAKLSDEELTTLTLNDFQLNEENGTGERRIGFF